MANGHDPGVDGLMASLGLPFFRRLATSPIALAYVRNAVTKIATEKLTAVKLGLVAALGVVDAELQQRHASQPQSSSPSRSKS